MLAPAIFLLALVLVWWRPLPEIWDPFIAWRRMAQNLALRVNRPGRSAAQQRLAGLLALLMLLVPIWLLAALVRPLSMFPPLFDLLLLYVCLRIAPIKTSQDISAAGQALLSGLLTPLLLYWLGGSLAVLAFVLLQQAADCWQPQRPRMQDFGHWPNQLVTWLCWPAQQLLNLSLRGLSSDNKLPGSMQQLTQSLEPSAALKLMHVLAAMWLGVYLLVASLQLVAF